MAEPSSTEALAGPAETTSRRVNVLVVGVVVLFALWFPRSGFYAYLTGDDIMNVHAAWEQSYWQILIQNLFYFTPGYRPFGSLVYRLLYDIGGLNPVLFRLVCFGLMSGNLFLMYRTATAIGGKELGVLTVLLGAYNAGLADLYLNSGTIYDLLCFAFYFSALYVYVTARTARSMAVVLILYIFALNSKETAVTLPLILIGYEVIVARSVPRLRWRWVSAVLMGFLTVPYVIGKLSSSTMQSDPYRLHLGIRTYFRAMAHYLETLTLPPHFRLEWADAAVILLLTGAIAIALRRSVLLFAWYLVLVTALPVAFISLRGAYVMYIAYFGISLYVGALVVELHNILSSWVAGPAAFLSDETRRLLKASVVTWFVTVLVLFHHSRPLAPISSDDHTLRLAAEQLLKMQPKIDRDKTILFLDDPFLVDSPALVQLVRLQHRAPRMVVRRLKQMTPRPDQNEIDSYHHLLTFQGSELISIRPVN